MTESNPVNLEVGTTPGSMTTRKTKKPPKQNAILQNATSGIKRSNSGAAVKGK